MSITSVYYFIFLLLSIIFYYVFPKKWQWIFLMFISIVFYYFAGTFYTIIFIFISTILAYLSTIIIEKSNDYNKKLILIGVFICIFVNVALWFLLKGSSFYILTFKILHRIFPIIPKFKRIAILEPLGMGYYTAQVIGYILDCYWKIEKPQRNIFKLFLFIVFFPQLIVGPISKYQELECLYDKHSFKYENIAHGSQRIVWGLFKKLIIADRLAILINNIWSDTLFYNGIWIWIAVFLYPIEIYNDFSGCMDIVIGSSELFDIKLVENFRQPFFSRNVQEFWQRWHITLGRFAKDYIYYPILKSEMMQKIGTFSKKHFNKRIGKLIPLTITLGMLWFVMGFWHGSSRHIVGVSLWFFAIIILSEFLKPFFNKIIEILKINSNTFGFRLFEHIRTYIIYAVGSIWFTASSLKEGLRYFIIFINSFKYENYNPWIFSDKSFLKLGLDFADLNLLIVTIVVVLLVDIMNEKYGDVRLWVDKQNIGFRWLLYILLVFSVLIFGMYGPEFEAKDFIYGGF